MGIRAQQSSHTPAQLAMGQADEETSLTEEDVAGD